MGIDEARYGNRPRLGIENFRHYVLLTQICDEILRNVYSVQARKRDRQSEESRLILESIARQMEAWKADCPNALMYHPGNCYQLPHVYVMKAMCFVADVRGRYNLHIVS
jgi:hypothetical protein